MIEHIDKIFDVISMLIVLLAIFAIIDKLYAVNGIFVVIAILFATQIKNETNKSNSNNNSDIVVNSNNFEMNKLNEKLIQEFEKEINKKYEMLGKYNKDGHIDWIERNCF